MKPYHAIIVLLVIVCGAFVVGKHGYNCAEEDIVADMNQALEQTLAEKQEGWITPDTIIDYRSHLKIAALRQTSIIYYADDKNGGLSSRKMEWRNNNGKSLTFQGYANCSFASVFSMSDQRPTMLISLIAMMWALFSLYYFRKKNNFVVIGSMMMDRKTQKFLTVQKEDIELTPMQEQLMRMFFNAENHQLGKWEICKELWPKKPDASDTLYTLIRRIRPILTKNGLSITTGRGKNYQLRSITNSLS